MSYALPFEMIEALPLETIEYEIGQHWLSYLINGDATGLDEGEAEKFDAWLKDQEHNLPDNSGFHWTDKIDDEGNPITNEFARCEFTGLMSATATVLLVYRYCS
jgi:hypothetical protein